MENVIDEIKLSEGEKLVKKYHCAEMTFPTSKGHLYVTNKRVIFQGRGSNRRAVDDVPLDAVGGISGSYGRTLIIQHLVIGIVVLIAAAAIANLSGAAGALGMAIAAALLYLSYPQTFCINIYSSKAGNCPISVGGKNQSFGQSFSLKSELTSETDIMLSELGAMIVDLQTMGDLAIEKWANK